MRLTAFTDYSLRVLIYLAVRPDRRTTIGEIAAAFGISQGHLMKVVHFLGRHGFLSNVRGRGGGLSLARAPQAINVGAVVRLTESDTLPAECFDRDNNTCVITPACQLRRVIADAVRAFYAALDQHTLADLVTQRRALAQILSIPLDGLAGSRRPRSTPGPGRA